MAPPVLMRHKSAVTALQASVNERIRDQAAEIIERLYAPPAPGDDGAVEQALGYAAASSSALAAGLGVAASSSSSGGGTSGARAARKRGRDVDHDDDGE